MILSTHIFLFASFKLSGLQPRDSFLIRGSILILSGVLVAQTRKGNTLWLLDSNLHLSFLGWVMN